MSLGNASPRLRFAYLGPAGTFTEAALRQVVSPAQADYLPQIDVVTSLDMVRRGDADFAVVPIENSVEGGVTATLDTLAEGDPLLIVREMVVPVGFVLAARAGVALSDVRRVGTIPIAWAQCRGWMNTNLPEAVNVPLTSTSAGAEMLAGATPTDQLGFDAALTAPLAAQMYGLTVLASEVADNSHAVTRFVVVGPAGPLPEPTGADKTTLVVHLPHNQAGALLEMLEQLATRGVNLSRIESRPIGDALGRYSFSMDAEGHVAEERMAEALMGLHRVCPMVRFLGSYPKVDAGLTRRSPLRPGTHDADFLAARAWVASLREGAGT